MEIVEMMESLAPAEGVNETGVPGVWLYKSSESSPRKPLLYKQGVIIVGQGHKRVFLGDEVYRYDPDNYLVLPVSLPAECEAVASEDEPFLSLFIDIDLGELNAIITEMNEAGVVAQSSSGAAMKGLFLSRADARFKKTVARLLEVLGSEVECRLLGRGVVRELLYLVMLGENAASLRALAARNTNMARIDKALRHVHENFHQSLDVDTLAGVVNMSPSAFHRAFKEVTASTPIQYVKKVRLAKAGQLLVEDGLRAGEAARRVGYESPSQFSREFKRYYGQTPVEYMAGRPA